MYVTDQQYDQGFSAYIQGILRSSTEARRISKTKYWDPNEDVYITTKMDPDTGYWGLTTSFRHIVRVETRSTLEKKKLYKEWDLGEQIKTIRCMTEVPDTIIHAAITMMMRAERRYLFKRFCESEFNSLSEELNPYAVEQVERMKTFIRGVYENLMEGNVHCTFAIDENSRPQKNPKSRRRKDGK